MTTDERYMRRCIELARNGMANAKPNPMVGAVVVCDGRIIGEGYHVRCGEGHAEVNALASVSEEDVLLLSRATIYVSLEPCAHYGKTPPCADLIVEKGLKRVVVGCEDPFAKVKGRGIQKLRDAGIDVTVGVLEAECLELNKHFMTFHGKGRPFVTLKWAQTAEGVIGVRSEELEVRSSCADEKQTQPRLIISNKLTNAVCHKRRAEHDAIMVGHTAALADNPSLTVREWEGRNPLRVVLARKDDLPRDLRLFNDEAETLVLTEEMIDFEGDVMKGALEELHRRGVQSLLVEGGRMLLQSFIDSGLWDEAFIEFSCKREQTMGTCSQSLPSAAEKPRSELGISVSAPTLKNAEYVSKSMYLGNEIVSYRRK